MIGAHIIDGDIVFVRRQESAEPNDIVAALVDGEATVKRFAAPGRRRGAPARAPHDAPIVVGAGRAEFRILGKVIGVLRNMQGRGERGERRHGHGEHGETAGIEGACAGEDAEAASLEGPASPARIAGPRRDGARRSARVFFARIHSTGEQHSDRAGMARRR